MSDQNNRIRRPSKTIAKKRPPKSALKKSGQPPSSTDNANITLKSIHASLKLHTADPSEDQTKTKNLIRKLAAVANKLSEANIDTSVTDIEEMYTLYPRHTVTQCLATQVLASISDQVHLLDTFVMTYAALLVMIGTVLGHDILASFIQSIVTQWLQLIDANDATHQRETLNISILIGHLYNFQIIACTLIYDLIRELCKNVNEERVDLILKIFKLCGLQLRHDDPGALKDISVLLNESVHTHLPDAISFRLRFMLETINDLAHGKTARHIFFNLTEQPIHKVISNTYRRRPGLNRLEPLRPSLDDIRHMHERGMWWRPGSAWVGHDPQVIKEKAGTTEHSNLLKIARTHGMNTDIRRAVFVTIMSSDDYLDAYERLSKLAFNEKQEREIVRVIVHCCGVELKFNMYYAVLLQHLCTSKYCHKITTQYTFWDFMNSNANPSIADLSESKKAKYVRQLDHTSQILVYLIRTGALALSVLRVLDPTRLSPHQVRFLRYLVPKLKLACPKQSHVYESSAGVDFLESSGGGNRGSKSAVANPSSMLRVANELERNLDRYETIT